MRRQNSAKKIRLRLNRCKVGAIAATLSAKVDIAWNTLSGNLSQGEREILLAMAELDINDLVSTTFSGEKLHHYTENGQRKIAKAFRKVRLISGMFPKGITEREFTLIDKELN